MNDHDTPTYPLNPVVEQIKKDFEVFPPRTWTPDGITYSHESVPYRVKVGYETGFQIWTKNPSIRVQLKSWELHFLSDIFNADIRAYQYEIEDNLQMEAENIILRRI